MKMLQQLSLVLRSSVTALEDKLQDPERVLHQLIIDMEEELERVRNGVAGAIADEIQLGKACRRAHAEAEDWARRAEEMLAGGDESRAEAALAAKLACQSRAGDLQQEHRRQRAQVEKLQQSVRELEDKIRQARQKQTLLHARLLRANSQRHIDAALRAGSERSAFAQFDRLERQVEREEALNQAYQRLDGGDPDAEELAREFAAAERGRRLAAELDALKRRLAGDDDDAGDEPGTTEDKPDAR